jgi:hypothetical protein
MPRIPTLVESPRKDGSIIGVNRRRIAEMPYFLMTNTPNNAVVVGANQSSPPQVCTLSGEGPAQIVSFAHQKTGVARVFMQTQDGTTQRGLMNRAVHIDTIMGTGQQPYMLPEALYVDELRSLVVAYTDLSGFANTIRFAGLATRYLHRQYDPTMERIRQRLAERQFLSMPYWYTLDQGSISVAGGATVQQVITIGQDHHFQIMQITGTSTRPYDINIVDPNLGESLFSAPQDQNYAIGSELVVGSANFPFRFHEPRLVRAGQILLVTITDRGGVAPNVINLTLGGRTLALRMWR